MTSRREFLVAAGLAALPLSLSARSQASAPGLVIVDDRFAESSRVGQILRGRGVAVAALADDDVTRLWLEVVGPAWQAAPIAIGGLTTRSALFCLEQLAWERRLRVVYHCEHVIDAHSACTHRLCTGDASFPGGAAWTAGVVERLGAQDAAASSRFGPSCVALEPELSAGERLMHSWIIAAA